MLGSSVAPASAMGPMAGLLQALAITFAVFAIILLGSWLPSLSAPWNDFDIPLDTLPLSPHGIGSCNSCGGAQRLPEVGPDGVPLTLSSRIAAAISGALIADSFALGTYHSYNLRTIREAFGGNAPKDLRAAVVGAGATRSAGEQSECGDELLNCLSILSSRGFKFETFAKLWRGWAEDYQGHLNSGAKEALHNLANGVPANYSGSHFIDLMGAIRAPALILLAEQIDDNGLALASRELQLMSHENPMALQAGDFLIRAALRLLRGQLHPKTPERRRSAIAHALHAAADGAGSQFHAVIDDALSEAQSRDNHRAALLGAGAAAGASAGGERDIFKDAQEDMEVIGRLTASGDQLGQEVQGGKTSYIIPAIIWLVVAYDTFSDAVLANFALGGESSVRAIFVGLLMAARDGQRAIPHAWVDQLVARPELKIKVPGFVMPFYLCKIPGACHAGEGWNGERRMHHVSISGVLLPVDRRGDFYAYRVFVRIDASELLRRQVKPGDWDDDEDGAWEPPDGATESGQVSCLARYFQFTSSSGRHAPVGLWPAEALCQLTQDAPVAHESFDVVLPERLRDLIGGAVIGNKDRIVKIPALTVSYRAKAPPWEKLCDHVGTFRLPEGKWTLEDIPKR